MYFQIKVSKAGRCHNLVNGRNGRGNFRGKRPSWSSYFTLFGIVYITRVTKFAHGRRSLSNEKLQNGKKSLDEKETNGPKEERNNP
jgi:hypothetical protein